MQRKKTKQPSKQAAMAKSGNRRADETTLALLLGTMQRLKQDKLTAADKEFLHLILTRISRDEDVREYFIEQVPGRPSEPATGERDQRIAALGYVLKQHGAREKQRTLDIAVLLDVSAETVRRAVKALGNSAVLIARMKLVTDPSYRKQLLQLGLTDADIEKLATKLRSS